jgi:type I protein arginine methyltransferase
MTNEKENSAVLGQFIPLHYHFNMMRDSPRVLGFKEALEKLVPEGGRVLELGGGSGILSFFAAHRASKVWCVERNPELVEASKKFLSLNPLSQKIEVVQADAMDYLPPEPVDVVICEMIHVGLLREKQIEIIRSFKERYRKKFGEKLPLFIPEASILAVQPVQQLFNFSGFYAPAPLFYDPHLIHDETKGLSEPFNYNMTVYSQELLPQFICDTILTIQTHGDLNALRFITKNALGILVEEKKAIDWFSQYLVIPLPQTISAKKGDQIRIRFSYEPGASLDTLLKSVQVNRTNPTSSAS